MSPPILEHIGISEFASLLSRAGTGSGAVGHFGQSRTIISSCYSATSRTRDRQIERAPDPRQQHARSTSRTCRTISKFNGQIPSNTGGISVPTPGDPRYFQLSHQAQPRSETFCTKSAPPSSCCLGQKASDSQDFSRPIATSIACFDDSAPRELAVLGPNLGRQGYPCARGLSIEPRTIDPCADSTDSEKPAFVVCFCCLVTRTLGETPKEKPKRVQRWSWQEGKKKTTGPSLLPHARGISRSSSPNPTLTSKYRPAGVTVQDNMFGVGHS
ncbi:hypothetical protein F5X68DRAFT_59969 [Plectosphaerella plurivora]|uniref:Uncharacterized protein n=1 Tax=Plectosphaerella plurivora TaxID=936078 RepID=A0A9P8VK71_9PEZI|nr:hypothetical protein F5X68DRAFT_59969 [Plectosphaerella plurivora]